MDDEELKQLQQQAHDALISIAVEALIGEIFTLADKLEAQAQANGEI